MSISRKLTPSSFDVTVLAKELSAILVNTRLNSITNGTKTTYLLRFHASTSVISHCLTKDTALLDVYSRPVVIIEPGFYMHTTLFDWNKAIPPTAFTSRLRSELCNLICMGVSQFYFDRVIILEFGRYNSTFRRYLIVELYGRGNMLLADERYTILAAQSKMIGHHIGGNYFQMHGDSHITLDDIERSCTLEYFKQILAKSSKQKGQSACFRASIAKDFYLGGSASAVVLRAVNCKTSIKSKAVQEDEELMMKLWQVCKDVLKCLIDAARASFNTPLSKGYIYFYREDELSVADTGEGDIDDVIRTAIRVAEYHIFDIRAIYQDGVLYGDNDIMECESYNRTLDKYNSFLVTARAYQNRAQLVQKAKLTLAHAHESTEDRVAGLLRYAAERRLLADCILWKVVEIDALVKQLEVLFKSERLTWSNISMWVDRATSPILQSIDSVDPIKKIVSLSISITKDDTTNMGYESFAPFLELDTSSTRSNSKMRDLEDYMDGGEDDDDDGKEDSKSSKKDHDPSKQPKDTSSSDQVLISVPIPFKNDTGSSARVVANSLFDDAKETEQKCERTLGHSSTYFQKIEKRAAAEISTAIQDTDAKLIALQKQRPPLWFERFHWFLSSDGYLVLSGRDAQSNELLIKKFMGTDDIFVHSEAHGAACTVIKAPRLGTSTEKAQAGSVLRWVPPENTIAEAGAFTVIHSKMWSQNVGTQAYWVYSNQVSKTAPPGMYIGTGSFVVRGKRNFISQQPMDLGVALLWRYDTPNVVEPDTETALPWQIAYTEKNTNVVCVTEDKNKQQDELNKMLVLTTQKQKTHVNTLKQAMKDSYKDERKQLQKERQAKIRQQKQQAKIKRLIQEGRTEEAEEYRKRISGNVNGSDGEDGNEEPTANQTMFCCICGVLGHSSESCTAQQATQHKILFNAHIPLVLARMWPSLDAIHQFNGTSQEAASVESLKDDGNTQEDFEVDVEKAAVPKDTDLLTVLSMLSTKRPVAEEAPGLVVMIAPYPVVKTLPGVIRVIPGSVTKGKSHRLVQKILLDDKKLTLSRYEQLCVKQIPEYSVVLGIPGPMNIASHNVAKILANSKK